MVTKLKRVQQFLVHELWREIPALSRRKAAALHVVRVVALAARSFVAKRCLLRASALAYTTLLSLVPLLAFAFSVAKGFGIQEQIRPLFLQWVAANQKDVVEKVVDYIEHTNVKALGAIGLLFLVWTTIQVLSSIEQSFNDIWDVRRSRTLVRKFTDYISVLVVSPLLLVAGMSAAAALQSSSIARAILFTVFLRRLVQIALVAITTWIAFAAVYVFMPNTRVRLLPGLVGGIVAGTAWQAAFWLYTTFQIGMSKYNAIYGTFAALPIFMVWLYVSWVIVLLGAQVSWAVQNVGRYWEERRTEHASFASRAAVALHTMVALAVAFQRRGSALSLEQLSDRVEVPPRLIGDLLQPLAASGLCSEVLRPEGNAFQPGRPLDQITPAAVIAAVRDYGDAVSLGTGAEAEAVRGLLASWTDARGTPLDGLTLHDIAARVPEAT